MLTQSPYKRQQPFRYQDLVFLLFTSFKASDDNASKAPSNDVYSSKLPGPILPKFPIMSFLSLSGSDSEPDADWNYIGS